MSKLNDEKQIKALGFDSILEYEMCMKCDYTNLDKPLANKKMKCKNGEKALNCIPFIMTYELIDRIERERGIRRGMPIHERFEDKENRT